MESVWHNAPVPRVVALAETMLHLRLPHELKHCRRRDPSGEGTRGQIAGGFVEREEAKLTVDGESDGRLLLEGGGGVDLHVRRLLVRGLRHDRGCGGGVLRTEEEEEEEEKLR